MDIGGWTIDWALAQDWAVRILQAVLLGLLAYFLAKAVKWAIAKTIDRLPFFSRRDSDRPDGLKPTVDVGERIGEVGYWIVWLIGFIAILNVLDREQRFAPQITDPLSGMVSDFFNYVPNVVGAGLILLIGFVLATIARRMVEATVEAVELDRRLIDAGLTHTPRGPGLARLLGILVFTLIIIPVTIAALQALRIDAVSAPAVAMLEDIFESIPRVIGAVLIIFFAYVVGRWLATLTEEGLTGLGFDSIIASIAKARPIREGMAASAPVDGVEGAPVHNLPPSRLVGIAVLVGIVLFASIEAARALGFTAISEMLSQVLSLATQVLFGAVIIGVGVVIANILSAASAREDSPTSEIMSVLVRWGVIALSVAVGLRFMGLANDIIVLAFGLVLGAAAVAVAIAFGVGGRDAAKRILDRWTSS